MKNSRTRWESLLVTTSCLCLLLGCNKAHTPESLAESGDQHRKEKAFEIALKEYDEAIQIDPRGAKLYQGRGMVWMDRGDMAKAIDDFDLAIKTGTDDGTSTILKAVALRRQNRNSTAISTLETALATPSFARRVEAYELLGKTYDESGDKFRSARNYANAAQDLRQAGDLDKALKFYNLALATEEQRRKPDYDWLAQTADQAGYREKAAKYRESLSSSGSGSMVIGGH